MNVARGKSLASFIDALLLVLLRGLFRKSRNVYVRPQNLYSTVAYSIMPCTKLG